MGERDKSTNIDKKSYYISSNFQNFLFLNFIIFMLMIAEIFNLEQIGGILNILVICCFISIYTVKYNNEFIEIKKIKKKVKVFYDDIKIIKFDYFNSYPSNLKIISNNNELYQISISCFNRKKIFHLVKIINQKTGKHISNLNFTKHFTKEYINNCNVTDNYHINRIYIIIYFILVYTYLVLLMIFT